MMASVDKRIQRLCEELSMRIQGTQIHIQSMATQVESTWNGLQTKLEKSKPEWGVEVAGTQQPERRR
jgi:hypothetical protein